MYTDITVSMVIRTFTCVLVFNSSKFFCFCFVLFFGVFFALSNGTDNKGAKQNLVNNSSHLNVPLSNILNNGVCNRICTFHLGIYLNEHNYFQTYSTSSHNHSQRMLKILKIFLQDGRY